MYYWVNESVPNNTIFNLWGVNLIIHGPIFRQIVIEYTMNIPKFLD